MRASITVTAAAVLALVVVPCAAAQGAPAAAVPTVASTAAAEVVAPPASATTLDEVAVDVPAAEAVEAAPAPVRVESAVIENDTFQTVGVTWEQGADAADLEPQVRARHGETWGEWQELETADESPDAGTVDDRAQVRDGTPSVWVGDSDAVQLSFVVGAGTELPDDLSVAMVASPDTPTAAVSGLSGAGSPGHVSSSVPRGLGAAPASTPRVITRAEWGAAPAVCTPDVASRLVGAVVHHTADPDYATPADALQQLRNDQRYHIASRGWCDIGYNFVVDKWGNVYEGRAGSLTQAVIGVHAGGFNTGTVGISVLGDYTNVALTAATVDAVARIAAWRLSAYGVQPVGSMSYTTWGGENSRYPAGVTVGLPIIFGHRDVAFTACPGNIGYSQLNTIRALAQQYAGAYGASNFGYNLVKSSGDPTVYVATGDAKYPVSDPVALGALGALGPIGQVPADQLAPLRTGPAISQFVRDSSGVISLVDSSRVYPVRDCAQLAEWGARCDTYGAMRLPDPMAALLRDGGALSTSWTTPSGAQYLVDDGVRREVADVASLAASPVQPDGPVLALSASAGVRLALGAPIVRTGIVARDRSTGAGVLLDRVNGVRLSAATMAASLIGNAALPVRWLEATSMAALPTPRATADGALRAPDGSRVALTVGGAVRLGADQMPADTGTPVEAATIAALAPLPVQSVLFVRTADAGTLYLLAGGTRRPVLTMADAAALAAGGPLVPALVSPASLGALAEGPAALGPGQLVKAVGVPTVYLVDGLDRLVFLPAFETALTLGVPTSFRELPAASLAGYQHVATPLGTVVSCDGQGFVGSGGRLWSLPAGTLAGSGTPGTSLAGSTCANLPHGSAWDAPVLVRSVAQPTVFEVIGGVKRPVPSMAVLGALVAGSRYAISFVDQSSLDGVPTGPAMLAPGQLVKAPDAPDIYLVDGSDRLVFLPSFALAAELGVSTAWSVVPSATLSTYAKHAEPLSQIWLCPSSALVGFGGAMHPLFGVLPADGAPGTALHASTCANAPTVGAWTGPVFARSAQDPALFLLTGGTRRLASTMPQVLGIAAGGPLVVAFAPQSSLNRVPLGPNL